MKIISVRVAALALVGGTVMAHSGVAPAAAPGSGVRITGAVKTVTLGPVTE